VTTTICFASAMSIPTMALVTGTSALSRARRALRLRSPREMPLRLLTNVLQCAWDTKPDKRIRRRSYARDRHAERVSMPRLAQRRPASPGTSFLGEILCGVDLDGVAGGMLNCRDEVDARSLASPGRCGS
jgi:hypothetical protein